MIILHYPLGYNQALKPRSLFFSLKNKKTPQNHKPKNMDSNQWYGQKIFQKQNPFFIFCNSIAIFYFSQKSQPHIFL
jgi:hypothetical protein